MWHVSKGVIRYDPPRKGLKKKNTWWCILMVDEAITEYYRWWIGRSLGIADLCKPSWGAHISIIRGEEPPEGLKHLWGAYEGEEVEFKYKHNPRQSGDTTGWDRPDCYWFVDVDAPRLSEIRAEFGFPTNFKHHLTVGRTW